MPEPKTCEVCSANQQKYKCPQCLIKYCSVGCFKSHKEVLCEERKNKTTGDVPRPAVAAEESPVEETVEQPERRNDEEITEDLVPAEMLQKLESSEQLKSMLENPHLQQMLRNLDTSNNATKTTEQAMHEPLFLEFADACLRTVEPEKYNDQENP